MTARATFTEADIKRAVRAMEKCGRAVAAVDFPREGGFRLVLGDPIPVPVAGKADENEWDVVLPQ